MGFDIAQLKEAVAQHGRVTRVVIAAIKGSSPREVGAAMLVWKDGQSGTIGGGALEFQAATAARTLENDKLTHHSLGPELGQCCGGAVTLLSESFDAARIATLPQTVFARPVAPSDTLPSLRVKRCLAAARSQGVSPDPVLMDGWMVEPILRPSRPVWVWGAGHVGRALVDILRPLPDFDITWVDTAPDRFPNLVPASVTPLPASDPAILAAHAPKNAEHLILTYSHALDLELCHQLLLGDFAFAGLIGSATKWARFRSRLKALGHSEAQISRITCPIGDPSLGKHPQMIAVGVTAALLQPALGAQNKKDMRA